MNFRISVCCVNPIKPDIWSDSLTKKIIYIYTTSQKFWTVTFVMFLFVKSLLLIKPAIIWSTVQQKKNSKTLILFFLLFKITFLFEYILKCNLFLWFQSFILSIITPVFSVTWSFRNHSNMLILRFKKHLLLLLLSLYYKYFKKLSTFFFQKIIHYRPGHTKNSKN